MSEPHSESYIDAEGEERCETCDKWLERNYYTIEDHLRSEREDAERSRPRTVAEQLDAARSAEEFALVLNNLFGALEKGRDEVETDPWDDTE